MTPVPYKPLRETLADLHELLVAQEGGALIEEKLGRRWVLITDEVGLRNPDLLHRCITGESKVRLHPKAHAGACATIGYLEQQGITRNMPDRQAVAVYYIFQNAYRTALTVTGKKALDKHAMETADAVLAACARKKGVWATEISIFTRMRLKVHIGRLFPSAPSTKASP